jgi:hypothetical protein
MDTFQFFHDQMKANGWIEETTKEKTLFSGFLFEEIF